MSGAKDLIYNYGYYLSRYPMIGVLSLLGLLGAFLPGLLMVQITNDPNDLWVNKDGNLWAEQNYVDVNFGRFFRVEQVIFRPRDAGNADMIATQNLQEIYWFQEIAKRTTVNYQGANYTINDLCWSALPNSNCTIQTPMGYWQSNYTRLMSDPDIHQTLQCLNSIDPANTMPCMDETGIPVQTNVVFGGLTKVYQTNSTQAFCSHRSWLKAGLSDDPPIDENCTPYIYNAQALGTPSPLPSSHLPPQ